MPAFRLTLCAARGVLAGALCLYLSGCALFPAAQAPTQASAFSWLTNWVNQPLDAAPGIDVEALRPEPRPATLETGDLLEVTVWDLYEPGQPYTFPVRVSDRPSIEVPLLGEIPVADHTLAQVESDLVAGYKTAEFLVNPRVLVRSLDPPTVKVQVSGAVQRVGYVELSRTDPSVYAALISAGSVRKSAGSQVSVTRRAPPQPAAPTSDRAAAAGTAPAPSPDKKPEQRANSVEVQSVSQSATEGGKAESARPQAAADEPRATTWYDLERKEDREALRAIRLDDGDEVTVKAANPPVRIGGIVQRPGAYPIPPARSLNVWQALELAGGVPNHDAPLNIALVRPAADGRAARRWSLHVPSYDEHPVAAPLVEPGDVLHVEPTAGSKIKRAVGDLWSKP